MSKKDKVINEELEKTAKEYADGIIDREDAFMCKTAFIAGAQWQKEQQPAECLKDALIEWAKFVLKCQEEELAKYDGPSYGRASTMGRIDAYKVLIAKLNSL